MNNHFYFVEVEHRDCNIKIVKFYLKCHRNSKNKYFLLLRESQKPNSTGNGCKHFLLVLKTLLEISKEYHRADTSVSFAFMGSPKIIEKQTNANEDGTFFNTIRFRIYKNFSATYYSPESFDHIVFKASSSYLIRNKKNPYLTPEKAKELLHKYISTQ